MDPDNRRPVDFDRRLAALAELQDRTEGSSADLGERPARSSSNGRMAASSSISSSAGWHTGAKHPRLFLEGDYVPLEVHGDRANHVGAFARTHADEKVVAAVPRLLANLIGDGSPLGGSVWGEDAIVLPPGGGGRVYRYLFTGEIVEATDTREGHHLLRVSAVFSSFPLALLVCVKGG